jgi:hypothetical protein
MSKLVIVVPAGRRAAGRAVLLGSDGKLRLAPVRVLATAAGSAAARHGNPGRDWRRPYGDTPAGSYVVAGALPPGASESLGALVLSPAGGNALEALRAGRTRFLLHGGPADPEGRLRATFGGIRVSDADLALLFAAVNRANAEGDPLSSVEVEETAAPSWKEGSLDEVPSSRKPRRSGSIPPVPRGVRASLGFGGSNKKRAGLASPGRRAFVGLALFAFGMAGLACAGTDGIGLGAGGGGGSDGGGRYRGGGGSDGGGPDGGYDGGRPDADAGPSTEPDGGSTTTEGGPTTAEPTTSEGTTTSIPATSTSEGTTTTIPTTTTSEGTTTGPDTTTLTTTTGPDTTTVTTTTGPDTTTVTTTGPDTTTVTTTGPDTTTVTTTGPDTTTVTTTGPDTTTVTTTGPDTTTVTTTGPDTTTTAVDTTTVTTTGADTTTVTTTGIDTFHRSRYRPPRPNPRSNEGSGT